jgi:medium-chain acyl-[acyl-carrier-protein] hydrolase
MEKYQEQISIKSYHTNQYGQASISSLFNILIEAAWAHAQVMDWGYDSLKSNNLFWVLSRMYFQVEKYPAWQDLITLNTWSAGTDGMYAYREYILENDKGEVILRASSAWLILDMETRKIFRLSEFRDTFPKRIDSNACRNPKRIKPDVHPTQLVYFPVLFSELDINKHFNSVKYVERVLDDFGIDFLNSHEPAELEVNYLKEGQAGDRIAVTRTQLSESESLNCLIRESDGADLCVMRIVWRERVNG